MSKIILFCIAAIVVIVLFFSVKGCSERTSQEKQFKAVIDAYNDTIIYKENKYNEVIASKKQVEANYAIVSKLYNTEKIANDFNIKNPKVITNYVKIYTKENTNLVPDEGYKTIFDTIKTKCPPVVKAIEQKFNNKWYSLQVRAGDSAYAHLQAFDTLQILQKTTTEGNIFNRKHFTTVNVLNSNPNVKTTGIESFKIETASKSKHFGIGFFGGYTTQDLKTFKPSLGFGINYSIFNF